MSRFLRDLKEFVLPNSRRSNAIPPLEAGFRPDHALDDALEVARVPSLADLCRVGDTFWCAAGHQVSRLVGDHPEPVAHFEGDVTALTARGEGVLAAVAGVGLVTVSSRGEVATFVDDPRLGRNVTALAVHPDGGVLVAVGSASAPSWPANLVAADPRTGLLLHADRNGVSELATGLGWPAGLAVRDRDLLVSLSVDHRIERRSLDDPDRPGQPVLVNLPGYPGRIAAAGEGQWLLALPYLRNRATELVLEEPEVRDRMVAEIAENDWLVPALRIENVYRSPMQVGGVRVLGEIKPWAPSRTYGLVARFSDDGRVLGSSHSRADGVRHGVTSVCLDPAGGVLVGVAGAEMVVRLEEER